MADSDTDLIIIMPDRRFCRLQEFKAYDPDDYICPEYTDLRWEPIDVDFETCKECGGVPKSLPQNIRVCERDFLWYRPIDSQPLRCGC
jgi:hypothetical protein